MDSAGVLGNDSIIHLVVVDDRSCLRQGLARTLRENYSATVTESVDIHSIPDISIPEDLIGNTIIVYCLGSHREDVVADNIAAIASSLPEAFLVIMTDTVKPERLDFVNSGQVNGIVPSSYDTEQLIRCLNLVCTGVTFVPFEYRFNNFRSNGKQNYTEEYEVPGFDHKLTPRQREVLKYVTLGKSNKYIAAELSLCESTVKVHVHEVMKRLGATSRTHASYLISRQSD